MQSRYYDPETGRFISPDSIDYLEPHNFTGMNLYAYCGNNPVMGCDPTGHLPEWLAWTLSGASVVGGVVLCATGVGGILGGVLIGAGAGSLINGYVTQATGGDFAAGYVGGALSGALCGVGAGFGGLAFAAASSTVNSACIGFLSLGTLSSFTGGFVGNMLGTIATNWIESGFNDVSIDWSNTVMTSITTGLLNVFAGIGSSISTLAGEIGKQATNSSKWAFPILSGSVAGATEFLFDATSYLISKLTSLS